MNGEITGSGYGYNCIINLKCLESLVDYDEKSSLATSLYASIATGGGRRVRGAHSEWLTIDNKTGRPKEGALSSDGLIDFDAASLYNAAAENGSEVIFTNAINDHNWYGLLPSTRIT